MAEQNVGAPINGHRCMVLALTPILSVQTVYHPADGAGTPASGGGRGEKGWGSWQNIPSFVHTG